MAELFISYSRKDEEFGVRKVIRQAVVLAISTKAFLCCAVRRKNEGDNECGNLTSTRPWQQ